MTTVVCEREAGPRRVPIFVLATDPVSRSGIAAQVRGRGEFQLTEEPDEAAVSVVVTDEVDEQTAYSIRLLLRSGSRVVVVATSLDHRSVLSAVEAGACAIVRRADAQPDRLAEVVLAARDGNGSLPADLLGSLLSQVGDLQRNVLAPRGLLLSGFSEREADVLRLVAEGFDTVEIAARLSYSERTVKNVIHDVTSRFNLRNRCHAVAFAMRAGVI